MMHSGRWFRTMNYLFFVVLGVLTLYPLWDIAVGSLMRYSEYAGSVLRLYTANPTLDAYRTLFTDKNIWTPMLNTVFVTLVGTALSLLVTSMGAYALSRRYLPGRGAMMGLIVFTMLFSGGMIPLFMVVKDLHLIDSLWSLILVPLVNTFYLIIIRTAFSGIPDSLEESAKIDGANDLRIFFQIIVPISMPTVATMILFIAVDRWNDFFNCIIYINSPAKEVLQLMLYKMVSSLDANPATTMGSAFMNNIAPATVRMATVIVVTDPVLFVYPFLQKYFIKGVTMGAVKG